MKERMRSDILGPLSELCSLREMDIPHEEIVWYQERIPGDGPVKRVCYTRQHELTEGLGKILYRELLAFLKDECRTSIESDPWNGNGRLRYDVIVRKVRHDMFDDEAYADTLFVPYNLNLKYGVDGMKRRQIDADFAVVAATSCTSVKILYHVKDRVLTVGFVLTMPEMLMLIDGVME